MFAPLTTEKTAPCAWMKHIPTMLRELATPLSQLGQHNEPNVHQYPTSYQHHANAASNPHQRQGPCYKCGGSHYLRNGPNATPEERERLYNMKNKWDQEEIVTETTGLEAVANKEGQPFKLTPTEQEEMVKLIQLLGHQHHQEHKQMQCIEHLLIHQSELDPLFHPHGHLRQCNKSIIPWSQSHPISKCQQYKEKW